MPDETRKLIKDAFIILYAEGGLKKANIKNLCDKIPIARTTFYAYYEDIFATLEEIENELINKLYQLNQNFIHYDLSKFKRGDKMECFEETLKYIEENKIYFKALLGKYNSSSFLYKWKKIIKHHFREKYKKEFTTYNHIELVLEQISSSIISAYTYWLFNDDKITTDEISELCCLRICYDFINL